MGGDGRPFVPNPTCRICWVHEKVSCASRHCFGVTTPATVILVLATNFEFLFDIGQVSACYVPILKEKKSTELLMFTSHSRMRANAAIKRKLRFRPRGRF